MQPWERQHAAVSVGGVVPLLPRAVRVDPAVASGPMLTTITDTFEFSSCSVWQHWLRASRTLKRIGEDLDRKVWIEDVGIR